MNNNPENKKSAAAIPCGMTESAKQYIDLYNEVKPMLEKQSCAALNAQRDAAMETFKAQGFPTSKVERYRYTNVAVAFAPDFGLSLTPYVIKGVQHVYPMKQSPVDVTPYYNNIADNTDSLTALNTALAHDAIVIYVPKGETVKAPIRIENTLFGNQDTMVIRRVLIIMEECSEATVFFVDHATKQQGDAKDAAFLTSQVIEVFCKDNSHLDLYELEETTEHCNRFSNLYIETGRDASVRHNNITLSNGTTRNGIDVFLRGTNSEVSLNGAAVADGKQHIDNNTLVVHEVPQCNSTELYKYVADDEAVAAFAGRILVNEGSQQTTSQMTNNNMCCTDTARVYTQPMLEIYADDVKCAHGSTVGVMDEAALFYMNQRGIPVETAKMLLKNAFISQVIDEMKWDSFRDRLHILIDKRLSKEDRCGTCQICKPES